MDEVTTSLDNMNTLDVDTDQLVVMNEVRQGSRKILGIMEESAKLWNEKRNWKDSDRGNMLMSIFQKEQYRNHAKVLFITKGRFEETGCFNELLKRTKDLSTENITLIARCSICDTLCSDSNIQKRRNGDYYPLLGRFVHTCRDCEGQHFPSDRRREYICIPIYKLVSLLLKLSRKLMLSALLENIALPLEEGLRMIL